MKFICYRCGGGERPENTILGIGHCQDVRPGWPIEMDLQMTRDGEIILFHDANTQRTMGVDAVFTDFPQKLSQELISIPQSFDPENQ